MSSVGRVVVEMAGMLFWPLTIASILVAVIGLYAIKPMYVVASSVLIAPLSLYLAATPRFGIWGLSFSFLYVGAALALRKRRRLAALLVSANLALIGWLGYLIIASPS